MSDPSPTLRVVNSAARLYSTVFAGSPVAPALSPANPVRRTGYAMDLLVEEVRAEAHEVVSLTFARPGGGDLPTWVPGAHLDVFLPSGRQRQYSLCGDPADRTRYRIAVRRIADGGGGSLEVHDAVRPGDTLRVRGPRNAFPLITSPSYLFIAGGIGVTPILPMVRAAAAAGARWRMVYLGRTQASMPFLGELQALSGGSVQIRPDDTSGLPDMAALLATAEPGAAVYLCGPPPLINAARALMPQLNPTGSLHTERFSAPPVSGGSPFAITLARSRKTVQVAADETALVAIRRELPDVRYSCQQGYCGTCKVALLAGTADHGDKALLDSERASSIMICVSRAAGDAITVDL